MTAVEMAIRMEKEAIDFYTRCAEKSTNRVGRMMFESIAEDEKYHAACAAKVMAGKTFSPAGSTPKQDMKTLFEDNKDYMLEQIPATADDLAALKIAMQMERDAVAFYKRALAEAATPEEKALFECLIKDEEEHFAIYQNTHSFLSDTGNWFMWEDHSIVEG